MSIHSRLAFVIKWPVDILPPMTYPTRNIAVLGATGSIGQSTIEVIEASEGRLNVIGISGHSQTEKLCQAAQRVQPDMVVVTDPARASSIDAGMLPNGCQLLSGEDQVISLVQHEQVDIVVAAIVGFAGLRSTWAALERGKTVALANKETLVVGGPLVMKLANDNAARIIPVDSEHSAIFQALQGSEASQVKRIILTASGGPFLHRTQDQLDAVTVDEALAHPTWQMGPKITVDSATMMNKALEIIEARWLFDIPVEKIDVVIHPQSIVHSLVEFEDGSVLAQLSPPDMKLPIQYALSYPDRWPSPSRKLDLTEAFSFDFLPADIENFPAIALGMEVAGQGGTAGAVFNAANETAVAHFLDGQLQFNRIVPACRAILEHHDFDLNPSLEQLTQLDAWARKETIQWIGA